MFKTIILSISLLCAAICRVGAEAANPAPSMILQCNFENGGGPTVGCTFTCIGKTTSHQPPPDSPFIPGKPGNPGQPAVIYPRGDASWKFEKVEFVTPPGNPNVLIELTGYATGAASKQPKAIFLSLGQPDLCSWSPDKGYELKLMR